MKYFLDTVFVQALVDRNDQHHEWSVRLLPDIRTADQVWTTEAVFSEVGAALSSVNRVAAANFIRQSYSTPNITVVTVDRPLFLRGLSLYERRTDKAWSLVDCISFEVMADNGIEIAISADHHYEQAGFQLLK